MMKWLDHRFDLVMGLECAAASFVCVYAFSLKGEDIWLLLFAAYFILTVAFLGRYFRSPSKTQTRPHGAMESSRRTGIYRRLTLRRADGRLYLSRWGIGHDRIGSILIHRMDAPDPGQDLHGHPWNFWSIILKGGYIEERSKTNRACSLAWWNETHGDNLHERIERPWLSIRKLGLDECHSITELRAKESWSLVITGPRKRGWGFYLPTGYVDESEYDAYQGRRGLREVA
jgi:hypothetical protein